MRAGGLILLMLLTLPAEAALYRWVDENGKVHYSDKKPPKKQKSDQLEVRSNGLVLKDGQASSEKSNAVKTLSVEPSEKQKEFKVIKTRTIAQPEQQAEIEKKQQQQAEAERQAKLAAEAQAKLDAERLALEQARQKAEAEAKASAEAKVRAEAEAKAAAQAKAKAEAERLAQQQAAETAAREAKLAEQQRQARAAEELRIAQAKAEAERQAAAELNQARQEMMELLRRAREAEAKALEAARIATEKLEAAQRQQQAFDNSHVEKPALAPRQPQPLPVPSSEVASSAETKLTVDTATNKASAVAQSKPKSQTATKAVTTKPKSTPKNYAAVPDDGLNCKVAATNAKTSLQKMISVNNKNFAKGYIPKANYQTLNNALQEIGWRLTEGECKRSRGEVRAFFQCMSDDISHLSDCGKKHNFGSL